MGCGVTTNSPIKDYINQQTASLWNKAEDALANVEEILTADPQLSGIDITNIADYVPVDISELDDPGKPIEVPTIGFTTPDDIINITIDDISFDSTITPPNPFTGEKPTLYFPDPPDDLDATISGDPPTIVDKIIPTAPDISEMPVLDTLYDIEMPDPITLDIPEFTETLPEHNIVAPEQGLEFTEEEYSSELLDAVQAEILRMLQGGTGLTDELWQAIIDQAATRVGEAAVRALQEAREEWASKGWMLPSGILDRRIREIRQNTYNQENELIRNTQIEQAKMEVENLQFAVAQGIALENLLQTLFTTIMDRTLRAATITVEISIKLMEAKIALYNVELQVYVAASQVHKTLIEAEIARVQAYKAEIEAQAVIGQVNKTLVDAYVAQVEAVSKEIEVYVAQVEAVKAQVEVDKTKVQVYGEQVKAYAAEVGAWEAEWKGYVAAVEGQVGRVNAYKAEVQAFTEEVRAYGEEVKAEGVRINAEVDIEKLEIEQLRADIARYTAELQAESARVSALASNYASQMEAYRAQASYYSSRADAHGAELRASIAQAQAQAQHAIAQAQINSNEMIQNAQIVESKREAAMSVNGSIAQAALSGINIQESLSGQDTWNTNNNYSC